MVQCHKADGSRRKGGMIMAMKTELQNRENSLITNYNNLVKIEKRLSYSEEADYFISIYRHHERTGKCFIVVPAALTRSERDEILPFSLRAVTAGRRYQKVIDDATAENNARDRRLAEEKAAEPVAPSAGQKTTDELQYPIAYYLADRFIEEYIKLSTPERNRLTDYLIGLIK
jgi:hypothetical protein